MKHTKVLVNTTSYAQLMQNKNKHEKVPLEMIGAKMLVLQFTMQIIVKALKIASYMSKRL